MMPQKKILLTQDGLDKLTAELEHLRTVRRSEVAERIHKAKELGGTANNAEYDDAKNEQAFVEGRILTLENMIKNATIIPNESPRTGTVTVGSKVTVLGPEDKLEQYTIVGSAEANPSMGRISNESPVGQALLGKRVGDAVEVAAPAGVLRLTIVDVK
ncbi:MAG: transcription elongation factor GreA [Chloroflexi bacterium]|nr:transcription elongation factor GreA [Chloroflexota bacterium]